MTSTGTQLHCGATVPLGGHDNTGSQTRSSLADGAAISRSHCTQRTRLLSRYAWLPPATATDIQRTQHAPGRCFPRTGHCPTSHHVVFFFFFSFLFLWPAAYTFYALHARTFSSVGRDATALLSHSLFPPCSRPFPPSPSCDKQRVDSSRRLCPRLLSFCFFSSSCTTKVKSPSV